MSNETGERERDGWQRLVGNGLDNIGGRHRRSVAVGFGWALRLIVAGAVISWGAARADDFQVNTYTYYQQQLPDICSDSSGNFVVVWQSYYQDGYGWGIFARHFDNTFSPVGPDFMVNTATLGDQGTYYSGPAVACDDSGGFVVVWPSDYNGDRAVWGRRFDNLDIAVGTAFMVNTFTYQNYPGYNNVDVAMDPAGGEFVVVWDSSYQDGDGYGVFGQRFASDGTRTGTEFQVNTYTYYNQGGPIRNADIKVAMDATGKFVVAWGSYQDGWGYGVFARQFNSAGIGASEFQVNTYTYDYQGASIGVAKDGSGNFVVAWSSYYQDGYANGVFAQRFTSLGSHAGTEFQVNTYTNYSQGGYRDVTDGVGVAYEAGGDFMVAWASQYQDGDSWGIFGQKYASDGSSDGTEFQVNTYTYYYQFHPNVTGHGSGDFVVTWQSYAQDYYNFGVFANGPSAPTTPTPTPTPSVASCGATPVGGCATPGKGKLLIKDKSPAGASPKDKIIYKWIHGPLVNQSDFGNPATGSTDVLVCIYANNAFAAQLEAPAGGGKWTALGTKGYTYKDTSTANNGLLKVLLKGGAAGKSKIIVKAKDGNISMPALALNDSTNVTVQVRRSDNSTCWQTVFPGPGEKNTSAEFKDSFP